MLDVLLDALIDSLKVLGIAFIIYVILSFFEEKIAHLLEKHRKVSPILGATAGLIPQCGVSVVAADLYIKERITLGTIFAVFFACSDEALPILLSSSSSEQLLSILLIIGIKFALGFMAGFIVDLFLYRKKEEVEHHLDEDCDHHFEEVEIEGCCHHHLGGKNEDTKLQKHLIHPLLHSLKIFIYCLIINMIFGFLIYLIGEENIESFLSHFKYFSPVIASIVGMIPNCASSVLITEAYLAKTIGLGATIAGLSINAGLGLVFLFKKKETLKTTFTILGILLFVSITSGYIISLIAGF